MKIISILILILLLFVPPVQVHSDAIIFNDGNVIVNDGDVIHHINTMDYAHSETHHKNNTEEESKEHHHICIFSGISSAIITEEFNFKIVTFFQEYSKIHFHKVLNTAGYLAQLFHPPIV
ncbi:hypothetical protein [Tenacibaculum piscium]|uniref:hypothetical protein n=1 Tax=Tenacibaculum piscium TaxID=1458515 RepID=UPI001F2E8ACF|nr:hypothetical protein [Tenacibaculum piscium]